MTDTTKTKTTTTPTHYEWQVTCRFGSRSAGYVGTYRTRAEAEEAARHERMSTRIKRVRVTG